MDFKEMTKELWNTYIFGDKNGNYMQMDGMAPDCVVIGTGKHEFYQNRKEFSEVLAAEIEERKDIQFQFRDFWCEQKEITPDAYLVYGGLFIWWESDDRSIFINMDSRFTIIYKRFEDGWKVTHLHQSLPNVEQGEGEYYPKTLSEQMKKEQERISELARLAQKDSLTDLINYRTFEEIYKREAQPGYALFLIDLDNFKNMNDTYGHMEGNRVLKKVAEILTEAVRREDTVCRMGGDEFLLLCGSMPDKESAQELMKRILKDTEEAGKTEKEWISMSVGAALIREGETIEAAFKRADCAMYDVKVHGKGGWEIGD